MQSKSLVVFVLVFFAAFAATTLVAAQSEQRTVSVHDTSDFTLSGTTYTTKLEITGVLGAGRTIRLTGITCSGLLISATLNRGSKIIIDQVTTTSREDGGILIRSEGNTTSCGTAAQANLPTSASANQPISIQILKCTIAGVSGITDFLSTPPGESWHAAIGIAPVAVCHRGVTTASNNRIVPVVNVIIQQVTINFAAASPAHPRVSMIDLFSRSYDASWYNSATASPDIISHLDMALAGTIEITDSDLSSPVPYSNPNDITTPAPPPSPAGFPAQNNGDDGKDSGDSNTDTITVVAVLFSPANVDNDPRGLLFAPRSAMVSPIRSITLARNKIVLCSERALVLKMQRTGGIALLPSAAAADYAGVEIVIAITDHSLINTTGLEASRGVFLNVAAANGKRVKAVTLRVERISTWYLNGFFIQGNRTFEERKFASMDIVVVAESSSDKTNVIVDRVNIVVEACTISERVTAVMISRCSAFGNTTLSHTHVAMHNPYTALDVQFDIALLLYVDVTNAITTILSDSSLNTTMARKHYLFLFRIAAARRITFVYGDITLRRVAVGSFGGATIRWLFVRVLTNSTHGASSVTIRSTTLEDVVTRGACDDMYLYDLFWSRDVGVNMHLAVDTAIFRRITLDVVSLDSITALSDGDEQIRRIIIIIDISHYPINHTLVEDVNATTSGFAAFLPIVGTLFLKSLTVRRVAMYGPSGMNVALLTATFDDLTDTVGDVLIEDCVMDTAAFAISFITFNVRTTDRDSVAAPSLFPGHFFPVKSLVIRNPLIRVKCWLSCMLLNFKQLGFGTNLTLAGGTYEVATWTDSPYDTFFRTGVPAVGPALLLGLKPFHGFLLSTASNLVFVCTRGGGTSNSNNEKGQCGRFFNKLTDSELRFSTHAITSYISTFQLPHLMSLVIGGNRPPASITALPSPDCAMTWTQTMTLSDDDNRSRTESETNTTSRTRIPTRTTTNTSEIVYITAAPSRQKSVLPGTTEVASIATLLAPLVMSAVGTAASAASPLAASFASAASSAVPASLLMARKMMSLGALAAECPLDTRDSIPELGMDTNLFGIKVQPSRRFYSYRGAVISCILIIVIFAALSALIVLGNARKPRTDARNFRRASQKVHFPALIFSSFLVVTPAIGSVISTLPAVSTGGIDIAMTVIGLVFVVIVPVAATFWVCWTARTQETLVNHDKTLTWSGCLAKAMGQVEEAETNNNNNKRQQQQRGRNGNSINSRSEIDTVLSEIGDRRSLQRLKNQLSAQDQEDNERGRTSSSSSSSGVCTTPTQYTHAGWLYMMEQWCEWKPSDFVDRFSFNIFDAYGVPLFFVADLMVATIFVTIGGIGGTCLSPACCLAASIAAAVLGLLHFTAMLILRVTNIYLSRVDVAINVLSALLSFVCAVLVLAARLVGVENEDHPLVAAVNTLSSIGQSVGLVAIILTALFPTLVVFGSAALHWWRHKAKKARRRRLFGDGSDDDEEQDEGEDRDEDNDDDVAQYDHRQSRSHIRRSNNSNSSRHNSRSSSRQQQAHRFNQDSAFLQEMLEPRPAAGAAATRRQSSSHVVAPSAVPAPSLSSSAAVRRGSVSASAAAASSTLLSRPSSSSSLFSSSISRQPSGSSFVSPRSPPAKSSSAPERSSRAAAPAASAAVALQRQSSSHSSLKRTNSGSQKNTSINNANNANASKSSSSNSHSMNRHRSAARTSDKRFADI